MASASVHRLYEVISILEETGVLDSTFVSAYEMKPARGSRYFLDLVLGFRNDMEAGLRELALTLKLPVVDYEKMLQHYIKIQQSATRIGACAMSLATEELHNAIDVTSKDRCNLAVLRMQQEYQLLRPSLGIIIELEHGIIHPQDNQPRSGNS